MTVGVWSLYGITALTSIASPTTTKLFLFWAIGIVFVAGARIAKRPGIGEGEERWFGWINRLPDGWFPPLWVVMQLGSLGGVVGVSSALTASGRRVAARRVAVSGTAAWAGAKVVKRFVGRGRPVVVTQTRILGREQTGLGYPSGHSAVTAAMALVVAPELGPCPRRVLWLIPAVVASTRLYVGAHLPLDVVGGAALGVACATATRLAEGFTDRS
jgi:undecaprenyl-diphosphatase